jgi:hypothetical protein
MSGRGLAFFRNWIRTSVDLRLNYAAPDERAHVLAAACRMAAGKADISLQEIEDEIGHIESAFRHGLAAHTLEGWEPGAPRVMGSTSSSMDPDEAA